MGNGMKKLPLISSSLSISCLSLLIILVWLLLCICCIHTCFVSSQCVDDEKSLLVEFKNNLTFTPDSSDMLKGWNQGVDCCQWHGVECDSSTGRVISLGLQYLGITGDINKFSSVFHLQYLQSLDLFSNYIQGSIPTSILFTMPSLQEIDLRDNQLSGQLKEFEAASSKLQYIYLGYNNLEGPVPESIFQLRDLAYLDLSSNRFNGTLKLVEILQSYKQLKGLHLSNNYLSIDTNGINSSFPQLMELGLANCNLRSVPEFLKNHTSLEFLDLSMNNISGKVPQWIWGTVGFPFYMIVTLNLSVNQFVELEIDPSPNTSFFGSLMVLDLHSNYFHGKFPVVPYILDSLDCSNNHFSSIDPDLFSNLSKASFLSFSNNNLRGSIIPTTPWNAQSLHHLDLGFNHLNGTIPDYFFNMTSLNVLNLRGNNLQGSIPTTPWNAQSLRHLDLGFNHLNGTIPDYFINMTSLNVLNLRGNNLQGSIPAKLGYLECNLQTLDLNGNFLQGRVPHSLANCQDLKVLDLGNNQLNDTFPCHLKSLTSLQVLVLRSNNFHGTLACPGTHSIWPKLQIVDLASNQFSGKLRPRSYFNWTSMMLGTSKEEPKPRVILSYEFTDGGGYYQNSVAVTFKGNTYELQYILTIFTVIDLSNNLFHGEPPKELGSLNGLVVLNLSHNSFSGNIPPSFGNLSQIQSLDLSCNAFTHKIPPQLAYLNFLEYLNLSFNNLSGRIPTSTQLQSFSPSSYQGNQGLYGPPLTPIHTSSEDNPGKNSQGTDWSLASAFEWMLMGSEVGFPVGIIVFLGPLLYIKRYREWYCNLLHIIVMKILRKTDHARPRRRVRQQRQRC